MKTKAGAILSSIRIDRTSNRKITVQLYMGLRDVILSGGLSSGMRIPATRTLASEIGVSRTTVIEAIDRLVSEGLLVSRVGAGTYVSEELRGKPVHEHEVSNLQPSPPPRFSNSILYATSHFSERKRLPHKSQAFVTALPALDEFPMAQWARVSARHLRSDRDKIMGYGEPFGLPRLRRAIASHLNASRGIHCDPEQIFVVGGAQQAFSLLADTLLNPGDKIWFENPGAIGARNAFVARGVKLVPVSIDDEGLDIEDGLEKAPEFRLAFVTPSHQQPLGKIMSLSRRLALLKAADDADAIIIEDDYDGDFYFGDQPLPTLKSIDTSNRVVYVGTFSKTLYPALRLGFLLSPPALVDTIQMIFRSSSTGVPTWSQSVVADFMDEGYFATHIRAMRALYKARHDALHEFAQILGEHLEIKKASAGFHTTGHFRKDMNENEFVESAAKLGVELSPISRYCIAPVSTRGVVIGYGACNPAQLEQGVISLSHLFNKPFRG